MRAEQLDGVARLERKILEHDAMLVDGAVRRLGARDMRDLAPRDDRARRQGKRYVEDGARGEVAGAPERKPRRVDVFRRGREPPAPLPPRPPAAEKRGADGGRAGG